MLYYIVLYRIISILNTILSYYPNVFLFSAHIMMIPWIFQVWLGTSDDWIGEDDRPTKETGHTGTATEKPPVATEAAGGVKHEEIAGR